MIAFTKKNGENLQKDKGIEYMNLNERYHKETGLHSHYMRKGTNGKKELTYTRKYVEWLESIIGESQKCLKNISLFSPLQIAEKVYKILTGKK